MTADTPEIETRGRVWGPWATAGIGLLVGLAFLISETLVGVVYVVVNMPSDPQVDGERVAEEMQTNGLMLGIATWVGAAVCTQLILTFVNLRKGAPPREYLALFPISRRTILRLLALALGFMALSDALTLLLGRPLVPQFMVDTYSSCAWPPILWTAVVIPAPFFEEFFFRGFLMEGFRRSRLGNTGAIILTALLWASVHLQYGAYEIATIFVLGVLLGFVRLKTGSLWSTVSIHSFINLVATVVTAIYVSNLPA